MNLPMIPVSVESGVISDCLVESGTISDSIELHSGHIVLKYLSRSCVLPLQFHVSFGCFCLVGAELQDSTTGETWEAGEPSFVDRIEPGGESRSRIRLRISGQFGLHVARAMEVQK